MASSIRLLRPSTLQNPSQHPKPSLRFSSCHQTLHFKPTIKPSLTKTLNFSPLPQLLTSKPNPFITHASSSQPTVIPAKDRLITILAYMLPVLNSLAFGFQLFVSFPALERAFEPLVPLASFYKSIPQPTIIALCALYIGIVRDRKRFSRWVRLNALQSLMLELFSVLPLISRHFLEFGQDFGFRLIEGVNGVAFLLILFGFLYSAGSCILGRSPYFPFVTKAIDLKLSLEDRFS